MHRPVLAVAAILAAGVALTAAAIPASAAAPPSVVQLCAATGIGEVDALLDSVATSGLVGELAPLVSITVPKDADSVQVEADVDLDDVRTALSCGPTPTPTPSPTPTPTPIPTVTPTPTATPPPAPDPDDFFATCDGARLAGRAPLLRGEPGYRPELDPDGDGVACPDGQIKATPRGPVATGGWPQS